MMIPLVPLGWLPEPLQWAVFALYIAIALAVTGHALLHKREVRAALAWIGVAWLSPPIGGLLYYGFGVNRVTRRALRFGRLARERGASDGAAAEPDVSGAIAKLAKIGERITKSPLTGGNAITVFHGGDEAYPAMLEAIEGAEHSVALASYIFRNDKAGRKFVEALKAAHKRGVEVRVLLDGIGTGYVLSPVYHRLRWAGVKAGRFLHTLVPWRMPFLNMRNHKKLLIVDGRIGFAGGLNIGAENCASLTKREARVDDVHCRIEGPAVFHLMDTFARDWAFTTGEELEDAVWWPKIESHGTVFARGLRSGPDADIYKSETLLGAALSQAQKRVRIVTPYFLPDDRMLFALAQARLRGVEVEIIVPKRTDYRFFDWAMRAHLRFFDDTIHCVRLSPPPFEHAKLMTVDGEFALIGSTNWDTRSFRLNFEFDVECYGSAFAAKIDGIIDAIADRSAAITAEDLGKCPTWKRLRDAAVHLMLPYL